METTVNGRDAARTIQVLFEISSAVNNTVNLDELYRAIHVSLGKIMDAENFAIALYHKDKDSITFPYFVDEKDQHLFEIVSVSEKESLTARVINANKSLIITHEQMQKLLEQQREKTVGSPSKIWAGVPLRIKGKAFGAIIIQNYHTEDAIRPSDLDILNSVSEFVAMAIERKQAEDSILQREKLTQTLFAISNAANTSENLDELYHSIYQSLDDLFTLPNFFIAIYREKRKSMYFPLYIDEYDYEGQVSFVVDNIEENSSITTDVISSKKPLLLKRKELIQKKRESKVTGTLPVIWMGIPLIIRGRVIGVMAAQHYHDPEYFDQKDLEFFMAVSDQVALAIDRRHSQEIIMQREKQILTLSSQTQELSLVAASILSMKEEKQVFDYISRAIVRHSDYNRLIMSYFTDTHPFREIIGFAGIDAAEIEKVRNKPAPKSFFENIFKEGERISEMSCYFPHTKLHLLGTELPVFNSCREPGENDKGWHPDDMLFIRMNDSEGNFMGVISVDDSKSARRPTMENVRPLEIFSSLISQIIIFRRIQSELREHKENLEKMVDDRTRELTTEISERIQIEKKLKKAKIEAEAAAQSKGEFLANMSHEIRTPINGILGMAEIAMENDLDPALDKIIKTIQAEADALLSIINQVLDFSKIEAGRLTMEKISFDLRHTFEQACSTLAMGVNDTGVEFISFLSPDVPAKLIGDPGRLRQILVNLTSNAIKFTHQGEIFVKCEMVRDYKAGVELRFEVKDTGIGIAKDMQAVIFDSFQQADGSTTRKYGGTGLGTTISKQLVELMGGRIGLESTPGKGSNFWFTMKLAKQAAAKKKRQDVPGVSISGLKALVVDENDTSRGVILSYLASFGIQAIEVKDMNRALGMLEKEKGTGRKADLVILQARDSRNKTFELAGRIRKNKALKKIPIVMITAPGRQGDGAACRKAGINAYMVKPVKHEELKNVITSVMSPVKDDAGEKTALVTRHSIAEQSYGHYQVLLAEDYPTNRQVAVRHLRSAGYGVRVAENGEEAVQMFLNRRFDLILMDIQMPVMDGYAATKKIRRHEASKAMPRTPIVAMTAHALTGYHEKCLKAGMDDYMTKPLKRETFLAMVRKWTAGAKGSNRQDPGRQAVMDAGKTAARVDRALLDQAPVDRKDTMDIRQALDEFENDTEFLFEVIQEFFEAVDRQMPKIALAVSSSNKAVIQKEAHAIKGGAANLTAVRLSEAASDLEKAGKSGDLEKCRTAFRRLREEVDAVHRYMETVTVEMFSRDFPDGQ